MSVTLVQVKKAFPKGKTKNGEYHIPCVIDRHQKRELMGIREENGTLLVHCLAGCEQAAVFKKLVSDTLARCGDTQQSSTAEPIATEPAPVKKHTFNWSFERLEQAEKRLSDAEKFLSSRGIIMD